jgi:hypothetical protein
MTKTTHVFLLLATVAMIGCGEPATQPVAQSSNFDSSKFLLNAEPEGGLEIIAARESAKDTDDVVVIGRIGGSLNPWVDGRAVFSLVDCSLLACSDEKEDGEECSCKTPWDYCCETPKLPGAMALVKFVDDDGSVIKHDAREVFDVKELETIVVQGKAQRDEAGNLTVLATGMYVRK